MTSGGLTPDAPRERSKASGKLHEDRGTTPAAINACLHIADARDVQVAIHADTLNESGFVENTLAAFRGRTIHTKAGSRPPRYTARPVGSRGGGLRPWP